MEVNIAEAKDLILDSIKAKLPVMMHSSPGLGKSSVVKQIAQEYDLHLIDLRLSQLEPIDLCGFPMVDKDTGIASYMPMDTFVLEGQPIPENKGGVLLFLDEFNAASKSVQIAAYKLVLDRQVGQHNLHEKTAIVCAGNLSTDNSIVNKLSTAMQSRLLHLEVTINYRVWLEWAVKNDIDHRIISFINFKPDSLYTFDPKHNDLTYASPRTWEYVHKLLGVWGSDKEIDTVKLPLLSGAISEGMAREFFIYCQIFNELPTIQQVMNNPEGIPIKDEPSVMYALTGAVANNCDKSNIEQLMKFINRVPIEFQVITIRQILKKHKSLLVSKPIKEWFRVNPETMFD